MGDPRPELGDRWPLVGRDRHLSALTTIDRGVVLVGAAGVGKTRLAREAVAHLAAKGHATECVAATRSTAAIPLGAVSHLLPGLANESQLSVLHSVATHFADLHHGSSLPVVAVDDAHLLDDASAAVIHHLVARELVLLIMTVRAGEPCPDAVGALWKDSLASRVGLAELPADAVDELLDHAFGDRLAQVSRRRLHRVSAGNPLLLREILLNALDTGELRIRQRAWRWTGEVGATPRLSEIVAARLGAVQDSVYTALEVVAGGEPVPVSLLEQLVGSAAVITAERKGLVTMEDFGRRLVARLSHPLYGEVIRSTMAATRARAVAGQLADAMMSTPMRRRDDALRVGTFQLQSGRSGDPAILLDAAKQAKDRFDHALAERLARSAIESGAGWPAEQLLAEVLADRGRYNELTVPDSPAECDVADASSVWILLFDSRCAEALAQAEKVFRSTADPQALVWAASAGIAAAGFLGQHDRAEQMYRIAAAHATEIPWGPAQLGYGRCLSLLAAGRLNEAWELTDSAYQAAVPGAAADEAIAPLGGWAGFRGAVAKARGQLGVAVASLREVLVLMPNYDTFRLSATCLAELAGAQALAGDHRQAARLLDRADSPSRHTSRLFQPWIELNRAWVMAAGGEISKAAAHTRDTAEVARRWGLPTVEAFALYDTARLGEPRSVQVRLSELAGELDCALISAFATATSALVTSNADRLVIAADTFERLGMWLHAAEVVLAAARLAQSAGSHSKAAAAAERANGLLRRIPGARTPMLTTAGLPSMLTQREREVALLAASGLSSRRIAARLGLSVRTVDNYLGRAYVKLGIASRAELAPLLSPRGPA